MENLLECLLMQIIKKVFLRINLINFLTCFLFEKIQMMKVVMTKKKRNQIVRKLTKLKVLGISNMKNLAKKYARFFSKL